MEAAFGTRFWKAHRKGTPPEHSILRVFLVGVEYEPEEVVTQAWVMAAWMAVPGRDLMLVSDVSQLRTFFLDAACPNPAFRALLLEGLPPLPFSRSRIVVR